MTLSNITVNNREENEALLNLYASKWENLSAATKSILEDETLDEKPANPYLLCIREEEEYKSADIRLMVFGQETNGWCSGCSTSIDAIQTEYNKFVNGGECWAYGGQFWNGVSRFLASLKTKFPNKKVCLISNNIVKIGKQDDKGFPEDHIYEMERENFHVIPAELEILKPNVVVFFTGPNYDSVIKDNFGELKYEALPNSTERQLSRVTLKDVEFAYRTYHPNYLWRNDIDDYFDTIISDINF